MLPSLTLSLLSLLPELSELRALLWGEYPVNSDSEPDLSLVDDALNGTNLSMEAQNRLLIELRPAPEPAHLVPELPELLVLIAEVGPHLLPESLDLLALLRR